MFLSPLDVRQHAVRVDVEPRAAELDGLASRREHVQLPRVFGDTPEARLDPALPSLRAELGIVAPGNEVTPSAPVPRSEVGTPKSNCKRLPSVALGCGMRSARHSSVWRRVPFELKTKRPLPSSGPIHSRRTPRECTDACALQNICHEQRVPPKARREPVVNALAPARVAGLASPSSALSVRLALASGISRSFFGNLHLEEKSLPARAPGV
jgi:hypothetical protein